MAASDDHQRIQAAIQQFAQAYEALELLQKEQSRRPEAERLLPGKGDQKTGLIGEYWAIRYARNVFKGATLGFGDHSQKGWDLKLVREGQPPYYIQVKTASAFGSGKLSPISRPFSMPASEDGQELLHFWNELWLLWLNRKLQPVVLWRMRPEDVDFGDANSLWNKSIRRRPLSGASGSACFRWDHVEPETDFRFSSV